MPRQVAPPPSGEFTVRLTEPFQGAAAQVIEVIGEPNRTASMRVRRTDAANAVSEKTGAVPSDDVAELLALVSGVRGFPSHAEHDVYGRDAVLELATFEIQWSNKEQDPAANEVNEIAGEQKDEFARVVESIQALARTFAKNDAAV